MGVKTAASLFTVTTLGVLSSVAYLTTELARTTSPLALTALASLVVTAAAAFLSIVLIGVVGMCAQDSKEVAHVAPRSS